MELNDMENSYRARSEFRNSQCGKQVLVHDEFKYNKNKTHQPKKSRAFVYWLCKRNRDIKCPAKITTDEGNRIVLRPTSRLSKLIFN